MSSNMWKNMDRDLKDGDIIRTTVTNKTHKHYGMHYYGIATGGGFGSRLDTLGNAIFVKTQSHSMHTIMERKAGRLPIYEYDFNRWERFWGIEILEVE